MRLGRIAPVLLLFLAACGDPWGKAIERPMPYGVASLFHTGEVDDETATRVLSAMTATDYNFAANLPEQVDRVDGRMVLRLATDDPRVVQSLRKRRDADPSVRYFEGLAEQVSLAVDGEPVDIVVCDRRLDRPVHTIAWRSPAR
jgi:hypothetical protein